MAAKRISSRKIRTMYVSVRSLCGKLARKEVAPGISAAAGETHAAVKAITMPGRAVQAAVVVVPRGGVLSLVSSCSLAALRSGVLDFSE